MSDFIISPGLRQQGSTKLVLHRMLLHYMLVYNRGNPHDRLWIFFKEKIIICALEQTDTMEVGVKTEHNSRGEK